MQFEAVDGFVSIVLNWKGQMYGRRIPVEDFIKDEEINPLIKIYQQNFRDILNK